MRGTCQGDGAAKRERGTVAVPGKLNPLTKTGGNAQGISQMSGQPSTPSARGEHVPAGVFSFEKSLLFST